MKYNNKSLDYHDTRAKNFKMYKINLTETN